jgi:Tol biopolymer transport system component
VTTPRRLLSLAIALLLASASCDRPWTEPHAVPVDIWARFCSVGQRVAFERWQDSTRPSGVYLTGLDGTGERFLAYASSPAWGPAGKELAVRLETDLNIWALDPVTGTQTRILHEVGEIFGDIDWSPNGEWITYTASRYPDIGVARVHVATGALRMMVAGPAERARWSPDSRRIVFVRRGTFAGDSAGIYTCDSTGSKVRAVLLDDSSYTFGMPTWLGESIVCSYSYSDGREAAMGVAVSDTLGSWRPFSLDGTCLDCDAVGGELILSRFLPSEQPRGAIRLFVVKMDGSDTRQLTGSK